MVFAALASLLIAQSLDIVSLAAIGVGRAASVAFLRLATLTLAQAFDLATFSVMVGRHGAIAEANPIVSGLFYSHGMPAVILAKVALVLLVGALCVTASAQRDQRVRGIVGGLPLALAITAGLIGGITNAATFLH